MIKYPVIVLKKLEDINGIEDSVLKKGYFLAGATDLYVFAKEGVLPEDTVFIDISYLEELKKIREKEDNIEIGSLVTHSRIAENRLLKKYAPALVQAEQSLGSPQIRNRGTIGGNVANASPVGDTIPPLVTLGARVETLRKGNRKRTIELDRMFMGPGKTVLEKGELITAIVFPKENGIEGFFQRLGQRKSLAIAKVSVALSGVKKNSKIRKVSIALGAVGPTVIKSEKCVKYLEGKEFTEEVIEKAGELIKEEAMPITDLRSTVDYRRDMCGTLLKRILKEWQKN